MLGLKGRLFAAVLVSTAVCFGLVAPSSAQQSVVFEVVIPANSLNSLPAGGVTLRQSMGTVSVYANGQLCTTGDVASGTGQVVLSVGLPGQPSACSTPGATLSFLTGRFHQLHQTLTIGGVSTLNNLAPVPPHSGAMIIVVSGESLTTETANGRLGAFLGQLTAKVGDAVCTTADVSQAVTDVALPVGLPGQPAACTAPGATVNIVEARGAVLAQSFSLGQGGRANLSDLALVPPGSQPAAPPPTAAAPAPATAPSRNTPAPTPTIRAPDTGSAGLADPGIGP